ncbi:hypothetical protein ABID08_002037 [Rhizobium binae]|uniref:Uncharacterized protein n=1 Tax=Rhizobium binae TaxID=1138190 RepID=A0ABV2ME10_9HYPH|nr:hypothetical protein [Rhizobium binae]MBX4992868.1 hypothetical protein [Rhizobium binae]NKL49414.1 hypothetical protein [Rhizobium leguminosarum bv. viciae]QSY84189.1 hypothetical protein J2J99_10570 [Rhizobium binae]
MLAAPATIDRPALPRSLLGRRRRPINPDYFFEYEIGQVVVLECTGETAVVAGRFQMIGCIDEYFIEVIGAKCEPLQVQAHQIREDTTRS